MHIYAYMTTSCDRSCRHCAFGATKRGMHMSEEVACLVAERFTAVPAELEPHAVLTGGGEPLLSPLTVPLAEYLATVPQLLSQVATSGCLNEEDTGFDQLERLSVLRSSSFIPMVSYSAFNPSAADRVRFTLPYLREISGRTTILFTAGPNRTSKWQLLELLDEMGYGLEEAWVDVSDLGTPILSRPAYSIYGPRGLGICPGVEILDELKLGSGGVFTEGRGQRLGSAAYRHCHCAAMENDPSEAELFIGVDGEIYPCPNYRFNTRLSLGNIRDIDFVEAYALRESRLAKARMSVLTSRRNSSAICRLCLQD